MWIILSDISIDFLIALVTVTQMNFHHSINFTLIRKSFKTDSARKEFQGYIFSGFYIGLCLYIMLLKLPIMLWTMLWPPTYYTHIMLHYQPLRCINLKFPFFYLVFMNITNLSSYSKTYIANIFNAKELFTNYINYFNLSFKNGAPSIYELSHIASWLWTDVVSSRYLAIMLILVM